MWPHALFHSYHVVDCVWGEWEFGDCSLDCGTGVQPMMRIKTQRAEFGGVECDGEGYVYAD